MASKPHEATQRQGAGVSSSSTLPLCNRIIFAVIRFVSHAGEIENFICGGRHYPAGSLARPHISDCGFAAYLAVSFAVDQIPIKVLDRFF